MINEHEQRERIEVTGSLDKLAWMHARRPPRFVDMVTGAPGLFDTRWWRPATMSICTSGWRNEGSERT